MHDSKNRSEAVKIMMESPNSKSNLKLAYDALFKDPMSNGQPVEIDK